MHVLVFWGGWMLGIALFMYADRGGRVEAWLSAPDREEESARVTVEGERAPSNTNPVIRKAS